MQTDTSLRSPSNPSESTSDAKTASSVVDVRDGSPAFGTRYLKNPGEVFKHNAWDNVTWTEEQLRDAQELIQKQALKPISSEDQAKYHARAAHYWNEFYQKNENRFFKDRNWLKTEFGELHETTAANAGPKRIFEVGCGAGNTLFPLLSVNKNTELYMYACDFSETAIEIVTTSPKYDTKYSNAFVWDLASDTLPEYIAPGSLDIVVLVFVLSALRPQQWQQAVQNVIELLKPGGLVLFRDYGRYDLTQLRFKEGRMLEENFYVRGDGTRVYFFTPEQIDDLWSPHCTIEQNAVDHRLIVNRSRRLKMHRVWLQGKFRKPA